ncbi:hypothetical protein Nepgr_025349 [Nepenthes gracilis]|uniref:Uncharacterized protein n=1 Tax=Nepenthes gracilis TaxID=150966 RepID=A0AAD3Y1E1_NEPGR|nr:hypothetical protein Nepgr_025349 [Nepenthes gracilis]
MVETLLFCCQLQKLRANADAVALGDTALDCSDELLSSFWCCWCLLWISSADEFSADEFSCTLASCVASWKCELILVKPRFAELVGFWVGLDGPLYADIYALARQLFAKVSSRLAFLARRDRRQTPTWPVCNKAGAPSQICLLYQPCNAVDMLGVNGFQMPRAPARLAKCKSLLIWFVANLWNNASVLLLLQCYRSEVVLGSSVVGGAVGCWWCRSCHTVAGRSWCFHTADSSGYVC